MGFKMAPSESTKVALGVFALAGIGIILYIISKQTRKKKKTHGSEREDAYSLSAQGKNSAEESAPKSVQGREPTDDEVHTSSSEASTVKMASESASFISTATSASISTSMAGWEDVRPMDGSFVDVKSPSQSSAAAATLDEMMSMSQTGLLSSFLEVSHGDDCGDQGGSRGDGAADESSGQGSVERGEAELHGAKPEGDTMEKCVNDVQSLQSGDTSNGEAPSFEQINGSDDTTSLGDQAEGGDSTLPDFSLAPQQLTESLPSFEKVSLSSSGLKSSVMEGDALPSFEHVSGGATSMRSTGSSIVIIPDSLEGSLQSQLAEQREERAEGKEDATKKSVVTQDQTDSAQPVSEEMKVQLSEKTERSVERWSEGEEKVSSESGPEHLAGEGAGSLPSFEVIQERGLVDSKEYYSSESLQSFATAVSGSSSRQDFYSPLSSPPTVDSSFDNSFRSLDDSTSYDKEASEELSFYDVEGRQTPISPQDRTPTNTPTPQEMGGGDAESAKTPVGEASDRMAESLVMFESVRMKTAGEDGASEKSDPAQPDSPGTLSETTAAAASECDAGSGTTPVLNIDRDKMTEAILQAQNGPEKLEIGQLQILVELLKREDATLLNTTLQCLRRATAFTVNVEVLRAVGGPTELCRLLQKFAGQLLSGGSSRPGGQALISGAPGAETLFLNTAHVANNLAMDIKSQPQLESSIPALTDLLMTEGISETVTLACLQPLTNFTSSSSSSKTMSHQGQYTRLLQQLYSFLDTSQSPPLRLQCLKLLVNLSLNADMVPHMLAAKAPSCFLDLLDINYDVDLLLRMVTFLANVMAIMQERGLSPSNLPPDEKAPSPETLLSALVALDSRDALRNKVFRLTRHDLPDIAYQASRLYGFVAASKK